MPIETTPEAGKPNVGAVESTDEVRIIRAGNSRLADAGSFVLEETGTFTPEFEPESGSFASIPYNVQDGNYVRHGSLVAFRLRLSTQSLDVGGASGDVLITGLPYTFARIYGLSFGRVRRWDFGSVPNLMRLRAFDSDQSIRIEINSPNANDEAYVSVSDMSESSGFNRNDITLTGILEIE